MLDFEKDSSYLVLIAYTTGIYNEWECPNPPYVVFRHSGGEWQRIAVDALPEKFSRPNLIDLSKQYERYGANGRLTEKQFEKFLSVQDQEYRALRRELINPVTQGCHRNTHS